MRSLTLGDHGADQIPASLVHLLNRYLAPTAYMFAEIVEQIRLEGVRIRCAD